MAKGTAEGQRAAVRKWYDAYVAERARLSTYRERQVTGRQMVKDVDRVWAFVRQWNGLDLSSPSDQQRRVMLQTQLSLQGISGILHQNLDAAVSSTIRNMFVRDATTAIDIYLSVASKTFRATIKTTEVIEDVKKIKDAPAIIVRWSLEQLLGALGIPSWVLPVVGIGALALLGLYAYRSFVPPAHARA